MVFLGSRHCHPGDISERMKVFRTVFQNLRQKVYCRDELVMQEGDTGDEMYVRLGGSNESQEEPGMVSSVMGFFQES